MRITALVKRICQEMLRDKRTLALLLVAPLLILSLMYVIFNGNAVDPKLGVVGMNSDVVQLLKDADIDVTEYAQADDQTVITDRLDGLLKADGDKLELTLQNSDPSKSKVLQAKIGQAMTKAYQSRINMLMANFNKMNSTPPMEIKQQGMDTRYIYGSSETSFFDVLSPVLVGFFVFFFVFLISGVGLLRERTTGTLERLMSTPISRGEVILGYLIGYGIFAVVQTIIVVLFAINVLGIVVAGSIWDVLLINLILALVALSLGILLSTFAASEFQMVQFIPIIIIPQVFFAGIFPLEGMANWLRILGRVMPIYYSSDALKGVIYKGLGLKDIYGDVLVLMAFAAVFITLNTFALKKYRKQ